MIGSSILHRDIPLPSWIGGGTDSIRSLRHLLGKELRESRNLLIAGLWTYWFMPAVVEAITYIVMMLEHQHSGGWACAILVIFLGWFFAVVTGAHVVCRDWGRAEEHFLRAQPVRMSQVVLAKWLAGLIVLFFVSAVAVGWDLLLTLIGGDAAHALSWDMIPLGVFVLLVMTIGYSCALVVAFATRQMLTAVLAGCLVLVTLWAAPYLSHRLDYLHTGPIRVWIDKWSQNGASKDFLSLVLVLLIVLIGTSGVLLAMWAARRESHVRLNTKAAAWTIAVLALFAFGMALSEVGNALPMRDRIDLPLELQNAETQNGWRQANSWCSSPGIGYWYSHDNRNPLITRIKVTEQGRVAGVETENLLTALSRYETEHPRPDGPKQMFRSADPSFGVTDFGITSDGLDVTLISRNESAAIRANVSWPREGKLSVVTMQRRRLPDYRNDGVWAGMAPAGRYLYLMQRVQSATTQPEKPPISSADDPDEQPRILYVYDWNDEHQEGPTYQIPIPWSHEFLSIFEGRVVLFQLIPVGNGKPGEPGLFSVFDSQRPEEIVKAAHQRIQPISSGLWQQAFFSKMTSRGSTLAFFWGPGSLAFDPKREQIFVSSPDGVTVYQGSLNEPLISYHLPWIAALFRSGSNLQSKLIDDNLLVNSTNQSVTFLDVKRPDGIRSAGFCNLTDQKGSMVFQLDRWLLIVEPKQLMVVDRP